MGGVGCARTSTTRSIMQKQNWSQYRTIVLEPKAESFVSKQERELPRFEEQWQGVEWILARSPDKGIPRLHSEPDKFLLEGISANDAAGTQELWILYSYDKDCVYVHDVKFLVPQYW